MIVGLSVHGAADCVWLISQIVVVKVKELVDVAVVEIEGDDCRFGESCRDRREVVVDQTKREHTRTVQTEEARAIDLPNEASAT